MVTQGSLTYWLVAWFLGLVLPLGIVLYGIGASQMGEFGPYVAFPMMLVSSILFGNMAGAMTGERRGASHRTKMSMVFGVVVLVVASVLFGAANRLLQG